MDDAIEFRDIPNLTNIQSFYYGQSVFITGVTGLIGKVVLEKILRCCPGVGMVYVHMRPKKGLTPQQRAAKLFDLELFRVIKNVFPNFRKHVQIVEGDITKPKLGLSSEDYEIVRQNVSIVIHSAASVNFTDALTTSVYHNIIPTQRVLDFCHEMPHFKAMVYVSTAFMQREEDGSVLEEIAKCKLDPEKLIDALEWMNGKSIAKVEEFLLDNKWHQHINYSVSKAMAEILIDKKKGDLSVAIVRPSIVGTTWIDPFPGWVDNIQGLSGLIIAGAKGVLRTLCVPKDARLNIIPLDVAVNGILASAWHVGTTTHTNAFIINCAMDFDTLPKFEDSFLIYMMKKREVYPLASIFRYPDLTIYNSKFLYKVHSLIDQWIPAVIIDLLLFMFTGKTMLFKIYTKITVLYGIMYEIGKVPWRHRRENFLFLEQKLSDEDKKIFFIDLNNFDWQDYTDSFLQGTRKFLAREDPSNIPFAKKKAMNWWAVTTTLKWIFILCLIYYLLGSQILRYFDQNH